MADTATVADISRGSRLYDSNCGFCHTRGARAPDLRDMTREDHEEFLDIVLQGSRVSKGMSNFNSILSEADARVIHAYVIHQAWSRFNNQLSADWSGDPANRSREDRECGTVSR